MQEASTYERIIRSAQKEFTLKGYAGASLRQIARNAKVTTGALYGYFKSKSDLFKALVDEPYTHIVAYYRSVLEKFHALPAQEQRARMVSYTDACIREMLAYIYEHLSAFKLILCGSEGSEYSGFVHTLAQMNLEATHDFMKVNNSLGIVTTPTSPLLEHMLTGGMFSTFFELIVHDIPQKEAEKYCTQLLTFYAAGWKQLLGF